MNPVRLGILFAVTSCCVPAAAAPAPARFHFSNTARAAGLLHSTTSGHVETKPWIVETTGHGVAVGDYDGDGIEDLYFANGSTESLWRRGQNPGGWLYRGRGDGSFEETTEKARAAVPMWGSGAFFADYDNDGNTDLYLTAWGQNVLLRNRGDGSFEDRTREAGIGDPRWSFGAAFADVDDDGLSDLYVANYAVFDFDRPPNKGKPCKWREVDVMCGPLGLPGQADAFYRNRGDGTFEEASIETGLVDRKERYGMGVVWFDADGDGKLDLFVANDSVPSLFFRQVERGKFEDQSVLSGLAYNSSGKEQASMGVGIGDADGDHRDELFKTNFALDTNTYYLNNGDGFFLDETDASGLGPPSWLSLAWATGFWDLDNDGDQDIYVVNGHVYPEADKHPGIGSFRQPVQLFENDGRAHFHDRTAAAGPGFATPLVGRGGAVLDADGDGRLDLLVTDLNGQPLLLHNESPAAGHWLAVELEGVHCSRDAIGARVELLAGGRKQSQQKVYAQGYLGNPTPRLHFGLGTATEAAISVRWPCGSRQQFPPAPADRIVRIREGQGLVARPARRKP